VISTKPKGHGELDLPNASDGASRLRHLRKLNAARDTFGQRWLDID